VVPPSVARPADVSSLRARLVQEKREVTQRRRNDEIMARAELALERDIEKQEVQAAAYDAREEVLQQQLTASVALLRMTCKNSPRTSNLKMRRSLSLL